MIGDFVWRDLSTPDPDAAKRFYARLFGWRFTAETDSNGAAYEIALAHGDPVGALIETPARCQALRMPAFFG
ncbi:MAG: VOC family protein [Pseudomonadota bacterium]